MRTFCICLPERPEQIEAAKKHFEEAGVVPVDFIYGVNAELAGLATAHTYERDNPGTNFRMGYKPTGIWLSHLMMWTAAMQYPDEHFMFVEVDAQFQEGWKEKFDQAMKDIPTNFGFLHVGSCCLSGHPRKHISGFLFETKHAQCLHCYVVCRSVLPFLLSRIRKCYAPLDCQLVDEVFPHLNTYAIYPRLVDQRNTEIPP